MIINSLVSDQLFMGPKSNENTFKILPKKKTKHAYRNFQKNGVSCAPRLFDRTLQTLWKIWMQMCEWKRTWPKILFICKFPWQAARNDLCSISTQASNRKIFGKFPNNKATIGINMRNKSGASKTQRTYLRSISEKLYSVYQRCASCNIGCKHDPRIYASITLPRERSTK